jgi:hypothetical protein
VVTKLLTMVDLLGTGKVINNYIIPGLRSTLLVDRTTSGGRVRRFDMLREQEYFIVPHDHRYNFDCFVLDGGVTHYTYDLEKAQKENATHVIVPYDHADHAIDTEQPTWVKAYMCTESFRAGDRYSLSHADFHSVRFSSGASVLFIEGAQQKPGSSCLLPYSDGRICNTFLWDDWMMTEGK